MDNDIRKRAYDFVISDLRNCATTMQTSAKERCDKGHNPGAVYRLTAIESFLNFLETISSSPKPWNHLVPEKTYDTQRMTKQVISLLKKHNVIEGTDSPMDILALNTLSMSWGLVDLIAVQMRNRLTRKKCFQLLESNAIKRWERAAETYLSKRSSKGKIRRCLIYLYINKLLPHHHRRDVQSFIRLLERYDNIDWSKAPESILQTKHRLEQLNAGIRQKRKKEREKMKLHEK